MLKEESAITTRLEALEKQNRQMKKIGVLVMAITASLLFMGQAAANRTVEASVFKLVDGTGKTRALWTIDDADGTPAFLLLDSKGSIRAMLSLDKYDSPQLSLHNSPHSLDLRIPTALDKAANGNLEPTGGAQAELTFKRDDKPLMTLFGQRFGGVGLTMEGVSPFVSLTDQAGFQALLGSVEIKTPRTGATNRTSAASLILNGKDAKALWKAP